MVLRTFNREKRAMYDSFEPKIKDQHVSIRRPRRGAPHARAVPERDILVLMPQYAIWQSRPVFVTSTFRDMQEERDYLRAYVFPTLEERLRRRYHFLEPIDLRWGVET